MKDTKRSILYYTKYSRMGASSRMRSYQYFPFFEENNISVTVKPLFEDDYLKALYTGSVPKKIVIKSYLKRFFSLFKIGSYDYVVIEYELFPYFPAVFEKILHMMGTKCIYDYDDAIFHNYDLHSSPLVRKLLSDKIKKVMKNSTAVIAGNSYLHDYALKAGAKRILQIPTVVNIDRYEEKKYVTGEKNDPLIIGWIGTMSTFKYMKNIIPLVEDIATRYPLKLQVIGVQEIIESSLDITFIPWKEETETENIRKFDVGIMPLENTAWEQGKCGYKLIQYMASGIPVIASAVGANKNIVMEGTNGYLTTDEQDWEAAIAIFVKNKILIKAMGEAGREIAVKNYSLQAMQKKLLNLLHDLSA